MEELLRIPFFGAENDHYNYCAHHRIENTDDVKRSLDFICEFYKRRIHRIDVIAERIYAIDNLVQRLEQGDVTLINDIARALQFSDENHPFTDNQLVIASRFCSLYNPETFPIFDPLITRLMIDVANENLADKIYLKDIKRDATQLLQLYERTCDCLNLQLVNCKDIFDRVLFIVCRWLVENVGYDNFVNGCNIAVKSALILLFNQLHIDDPQQQNLAAELIVQNLDYYLHLFWDKIRRRVQRRGYDNR